MWIATLIADYKVQQLYIYPKSTEAWFKFVSVDKVMKRLWLCMCVNVCCVIIKLPQNNGLAITIFFIASLLHIRVYVGLRLPSMHVPATVEKSNQHHIHISTHVVYVRISFVAHLNEVYKVWLKSESFSVKFPNMVGDDDDDCHPAKWQTTTALSMLQ